MITREADGVVVQEQTCACSGAMTERAGASGAGSDCVRQQLLRSTQQDLTTILYDDAVALPFAQQPARGEQGDVGLVGQFFIVDVEFNASGDFLADPAGEVDQHGGKPLARGMAGERHMQAR